MRPGGAPPTARRRTIPDASCGGGHVRPLLHDRDAIVRRQEVAAVLAAVAALTAAMVAAIAAA